MVIPKLYSQSAPAGLRLTRKRVPARLDRVLKKFVNLRYPKNVKIRSDFVIKLAGRFYKLFDQAFRTDLTPLEGFSALSRFIAYRTPVQFSLQKCVVTELHSRVKIGVGRSSLRAFSDDKNRKTAVWQKMARNKAGQPIENFSQLALATKANYTHAADALVRVDFIKGRADFGFPTCAIHDGFIVSPFTLDAVSLAKKAAYKKAAEVAPVELKRLFVSAQENARKQTIVSKQEKKDLTTPVKTALVPFPAVVPLIPSLRARPSTDPEDNTPDEPANNTLDDSVVGADAPSKLRFKKPTEEARKVSAALYHATP